MAEANPDLGTITDEAALLDSLFEEQGANPDDADHAPLDGEVVTDDGDDGLAPDTPEDGTPPEGGEYPEPAPETAATFTVKIDGKDVTVTQDELINGYMQQADYTRKTTEIAREREVIQAGSKELKAALEFWQIPKGVEPDWVELSRTKTPDEFVQLQAEWQAQQKRSEQARALHSRISQQETAAMLQAEHAQLLERVPEWRNPEVARGEMAGIVKAASEFGFTEAEVQATSDHRLIVMARELARLKGAKAALETAKNAPTKPKAAIQGRAAQTDVAAKNAKLMENLKRTNSDDAAVALLLGG